MKRQVIVVLLGLCSCVVCAQDMLDTLRVGMLLPLQADVLKRDKNMDRFADFYTGALLAVYEVQQQGQPVELYTYDVGKTSMGVQHVLDRGVLDSMNMVIGPAYSHQVRLVASWADTSGVRTLLPFSSEVPELEQNSCLMTFNVSEENEAQAMADYLRMEYHTIRCIFVESEGVEIPSSVKMMQEALERAGLECVWTTISQILQDSLNEVLGDNMENVLLMNTERFANLRTVMPHLNRAAQGKQLTLISRYSWQNEKIVLPQIYCSVFKQDEDVHSEHYDSLYNRFIAKERSVTRPSYDLLGYDMMHCVLHILMQERRMMYSDIDMKYEGLQSDIHFERKWVHGGYTNTHINVIRKK